MLIVKSYMYYIYIVFRNFIKYKIFKYFIFYLIYKIQINNENAIFYDIVNYFKIKYFRLQTLTVCILTVINYLSYAGNRLIQQF